MDDNKEPVRPFSGASPNAIRTSYWANTMWMWLIVVPVAIFVIVFVVLAIWLL